MIRSYLKTARRNLWRSKGYSLLNISGLSIGMAAAILILLWAQNERSFDMFHHKKDSLFKVMNRGFFNGETYVWDHTPKVMGPVMKSEFPEIAKVSRFSIDNPFLLTVGEKKLSVTGAFVDSSFLKMFDFPLLRGNKHHALHRPKDVIITQSLAKKLFDSEDVLGKTLRIESDDVFTVSGVLADLPANTTFNGIEYLMPWTYLEQLGRLDNNWGNNSVETYVELAAGSTQANVESKIRDITQRHSKNIEDIEVFLHALPNWWLYSKFENGKIAGGRIDMVRLFTLIAWFILLIACINFMNLSTARSEKRAREVGVRKVAGAHRLSLVLQFLSESILMAGLSGALALLFVQISLPFFNQLVGRTLAIDYGNELFWLFAGGFILFTGLLAGSYPAFFLSSFQPVKVLKGSFQRINATFSPRKVLIVFQFTIAIFLIISTLVINRQVQYGKDRESGYEKNNLVYTLMKGDIKKNYSLIKNELLSEGIAASITKTMSPLTENWSNGWGVDWQGKPKDDKTSFDRFSADEGFVKTAGLKLIEGRDFDLKKYPTDSTALLLNETAVKAMGFEEPIGQIVKDSGVDWHVVGIFEDFIMRSPYSPVPPMLILGAKAWSDVIHIKFNERLSTSEALKKTEAVFEKYNPDYPFEYHFVDEAYAIKFKESQQIGLLAALFAFLTVFISCLGLFGLAAFMAENRIKEVGIRKVLGASTLSITSLLSKEFIILVFLSCLIAFPIAYWLMDKFLQGFPYRITISARAFIIAGAGALILTLITVSSQAIRAAKANPVDSLRDE